MEIDPQVIEKARQIKLLVLDVDGVLTDGRIIYGSGGLELKTFDVQDGLGLKLARRIGLVTAIVTGRTSEAVERRARELEIDEVWQGVKNKLEVYEGVLGRYAFSDEVVAYAGDDLEDLPVLRRVGFAVAVANAVKEVKREADYVTVREGGRGAIRELVELILESKGLRDSGNLFLDQ